MTTKFPRISLPVQQMRASYDVVVVGSGYGGAIAASRMSRAGKTVAILEQGLERWPGEFPEDSSDCFDALQISSDDGDRGDKRSLYHLYMGTGQHAFVGQGLGGTSLINSNVALEPDRKIWQQSIWPESLVGDNIFSICSPPSSSTTNNDHNSTPHDLYNPDYLPEAYRKAWDMLEPVTYPDSPEYPPITKFEMLKKQADALGLGDYVRKAPLTTAFEDRYNAAGVPMRKSTLTGNETTGVNDGSKGTTLVTYVSDAWNHGAEIFCQCSVRHISRVKFEGKQKWVIFYEWLDESRKKFPNASKSSLFWVMSDMVFLGAGTMGSTEILLRSKKLGLKMTSNVGANFSGNGDILAFGYNMDQPCHAVGIGSSSSEKFTGKERGPSITGLIDLRSISNDNVTNGIVIQDGITPFPLASLLPTAFSLSTSSSRKPETAAQRLKRQARIMESALRGPHYGAMDNTMTYLVMSHDDNQGLINLKDDSVKIEFDGAGQSYQCRKINEQFLKPMAQSMNGSFEPSPFWTKLGSESLITVHPIGGCPMGKDGHTGVVNHKGQVFVSDSEEVYDSLYVCDGAIIPMAIGVNPFLTICALAERICFYAIIDHPEHTTWSDTQKITGKELYSTVRNTLYEKLQTDGQYAINFKQMKRRKMSRYQKEDLLRDSSLESLSQLASYDDNIDNESTSELKILIETPSSNRKASLLPGGVTFTELMSGYFSTEAAMDDVPDDDADYQAAEEDAKMSDSRISFLLTIDAKSSNPLIDTGETSGSITGTVSCRALSPYPLRIEHGDFRLFVPDQNRSDADNLFYHLHLLSISGDRYEFIGKKVVSNGSIFSAWKETTTLYVTVRRLETDMYPHCCFKDGLHLTQNHYCSLKLVGRGVLHLKARDLARELLTLKSKSKTPWGRMKDQGLFLSFFSKKLVEHFLTPLAPLQYPDSKMNFFSFDIDKKSGRPPLQCYPITSRDHVECMVYRYQPTNGKPLKGPLLLVPGVAVSHMIFASSLIQESFVDFLLRDNYDIFMVDHRLCSNVQASHTQQSVEAVKYDVAAAVNLVRKETSVEKIGVVAHCAGSIATFMGLLDQTIQGVGILLASNVGMHPIVGKVNRIKANLHLQDIYHEVLGQNMYECYTTPNDSFLNCFLNQFLRFYPVPKGEKCSSAVCHRASFAFGLLWNHKNLSRKVHQYIHTFIGNVNLTAMKQLTSMVKTEILTTADGRTDQFVTTENIRKTFSSIPIRFIHGSNNVVYDPVSTLKDYERLTREVPKYDDNFFTRFIVDGYGHLDCFMGTKAAKDVYKPYIEPHFRLYQAGYGYGAKSGQQEKNWDAELQTESVKLEKGSVKATSGPFSGFQTQ